MVKKIKKQTPIAFAVSAFASFIVNVAANKRKITFPLSLSTFLHSKQAGLGSTLGATLSLLFVGGGGGVGIGSQQGKNEFPKLFISDDSVYLLSDGKFSELDTDKLINLAKSNKIIFITANQESVKAVIYDGLLAFFAKSGNVISEKFVRESPEGLPLPKKMLEAFLKEQEKIATEERQKKVGN